MFHYTVPIYIGTVPQILTTLPYYHTNLTALRYCKISPIFSPNFFTSYQLQGTPNTVCFLHHFMNSAHSGKSNLLSVWAYGLPAKLCGIFYEILY